ncbi:MAG TPA: hypothetical protein VG870_09205 [Chitinophagaceae bacterium]|nr:hypothetical protein [Chitinophagaceae bacterium]
MLKIIAALDGLKFSESTQDWAVHLASQVPAHLVGVFLEDFSYHSYKIYDLVGSEGFSVEKLRKLELADQAMRRASVQKFEEACQAASLTYSMHHDRNLALQELLHESIYADLLVVDSRETLTHYDEKPPTEFIRDLLINVECPVLLAPRRFRKPDRIILLYDGAPSSVYAIKTFSYILPLRDLPVEVLSVKAGGQTLHLPDNKLMKELVKRHFDRTQFTVVKGMAEEQILRYLREQKGNPLVVLGAYRRGMVSRWFRPSMADTLMRDMKWPLFIAHTR